MILDSHGIIFRSYFALRDVLTVRRTGEPVAAVFGYANSLLTVLNELEPTHVIAAWDASSSTFRKERDERYKATRAETPEDLVPQFDRVRQLLDAFRIPLVELEGYEADDILGTLADQAAEAGVEVIIVTLDNDIVQLIQPGVRVYMYRPYQRDYVMYDDEAVRERWGFEPLQMVDYKALVGDNSDNIPGVKGIGEKGAKALIERYGTLEEMLEHLEEIEPKRTRTALEQGVDEAQLSKELATIVRDVPGIELDLDSSVVAEYDRDAVLELFRELEFRSLINRLPASSEPSKQRTDEAGVEGKYEVVTTSKALNALVKAVKKSGQFAFEVIADDPHPIRAADTLVGLAISAEGGKAAYVPFGHRAPGETAAQQKLLDDADDEAAPDQLSREQVMNALAPLFTDPKLERIAHDGKRGLLALAEADERVWASSIDFDTQIAAYDLGDSNMTLQRLAFDRLGVEAPEERDVLGSGRKKLLFSQAGTEEVGAYAAQQADLMHRVEAPLAAELQANELDTVFREIDLPHITPLARMEQFGVAVDLDVLTQLARTLGDQIETAEAECYAAVGHEFKIGSPQELSTVLFEELQLPKTRKTKTGFTTDANALEPLRSVHPVVDAILSWRELTKIKSTYVDALPKQINPRTGRVHSIFSQVTAATGRLSSNDPNLQNIPVRTEVGTEVRRAFVARDCGDDPILLAVDYSQIELRVLAHLSGDDELQRAFHEHRDIHASTASRVFHVDEAEVDADMRRRAKVFNFGVLYGLTAFGLSTREGIPRDEATAFIDAYFEAYPKVQEWRERTVDEARARGYAETLSGRRRYIPDLRAGNRNQRQAAERIAINMPVQGTASDIIKIAMNRLDGELLARREAGMQARMVLQVHDELIFELPREELEEMRSLAREFMPSMELAVPLDLDEKAGRSWGDMECSGGAVAMPELPEVETIRRDLVPLLVGRRIEAVTIHPGAERLAVTHAPRELEQELVDRRVTALGRHGKYLLAMLDDGRVWVLHLRMTGSLVHGPSEAAPDRFERARVALDDGTALRFNDVRKFGTWHLVDDAREAMPRVGPDALSAEFSVMHLRNAFSKRRASVKAALLDQKVAAGVGNIYADEACWIAGIDPRTSCDRIGPRRVARLHAAVRQTLEASLNDRGSSFSDYRDGLGGEGMHHVHVHVFRRDGQDCERCGSTIRKTRLAGRGTHFCPGCQRR